MFIEINNIFIWVGNPKPHLRRPGLPQTLFVVVLRHAILQNNKTINCFGYKLTDNQQAINGQYVIGNIYFEGVCLTTGILAHFLFAGCVLESHLLGIGLHSFQKATKCA